MIKNLRRKLVIYATASIFLFLTLILAAINLANFTIVANNADTVTSRIANEGGSFFPAFPEIPDDSGESFPVEPWDDNPPPGDGGRGEMGPDSPETALSTRYFTIAFNKKGTIATVIAMRMTPESATEEEAVVWARGLLGGHKGWTKTYYRYLCYEHLGQDYVTVIDCSRELTPSYNVLWASIIGGSAGTVISCLILIPLSSWFVKPLVISSKKQKRFIADASHELKTPLTIISAEKEIIELTQGESESTKNIGKQVDRLADMVKNLNALASIEDRPKPVIGQFDLAATCKEVCQSYAKPLESAHIELELDLPETHPFQGDEDLLRQLIGIFMDNATKYAKTRIKFSLYVKNDRTTIKVRNDADDIEDGPLDTVFERFYRSEAARASGKEGSGIGLSIAKGIVDSLHGRIWAKGENGDFIIKAEL